MEGNGGLYLNVEEMAEGLDRGDLPKRFIHRCAGHDLGHSGSDIPIR
ncbi:MAG: hypothetical protein IPJ38_12755 [Dechloromonas sp.]|uniref:Uncharacterized protein n=1 Tax=Candidatus Dechloromonas phosphorivorans TaxID=2899244 RepID=A0A935JXK9_9RHOO|nr:hypothetical protein [Candidatus Dechloromonas phosphorivorans]